MASLTRLDERLARIFESWGGMDRVLRELCIVLTADHAHSEVRDDETAAVVLADLLGGFGCANPARGWQDDDDLLVCPNMRAAEIYVRPGREGLIEKLGESLLVDERIDHILWRGTDGWCHAVTADRGRLRFRTAETGPQDATGACWELDGDARALDLSMENGRIRFGDYPNALERIAGGAGEARAGRVWVTARVGYEFGDVGQSAHRGAGSHGALHAEDSQVPLLVAGLPSDVPVPSPARIVDVAPLCAAVMGLSTDLPPIGGSHA